MTNRRRTVEHHPIGSQPGWHNRQAIVCASVVARPTQSMHCCLHAQGQQTPALLTAQAESWRTMLSQTSAAPIHRAGGCVVGRLLQTNNNRPMIANKPHAGLTAQTDLDASCNVLLFKTGWSSCGKYSVQWALSASVSKSAVFIIETILSPCRLHTVDKAIAASCGLTAAGPEVMPMRSPLWQAVEASRALLTLF